MSKAKPKGLKFKKKRMDIDAFIEDELNNLNAGGGSKPLSLSSKPTLKKKDKNPALIKPTFKINKRDQEDRPPLILDNEPPIEEKPKVPVKKAPFLPSQIKPKKGFQPINIPVEDPPEIQKRPQGPSKLLELQSRAKNRPFNEPEPINDKGADDYDDSFEKYDDDEFESDDDK